MNKHSVSLLPRRDKLKTSLSIMSALAHPLRLRMVALLDKNKEMNVGDLYKALKIEQALASQQLRILREADLVTTRRFQKFVFYSLNYPMIEKAGGVPARLPEYD